jgi:hypothetical protein
LHHKSQVVKHFGVKMTNNNRFIAQKIKVRPKGLHKSLNPDPSPLTPRLSTFVESALQIAPFCSNKAHFRKSQMNVTKVLTTDYDQMDTWSIRKNKPNSNPIQTQYKPNSNPIKAKTNPIQSQTNPISKQNIVNSLMIILLYCIPAYFITKSRTWKNSE